MNAGWNLEHSYQTLPETLYQPQEPARVKAPRLAIFNSDLAEVLGLAPSVLWSEEGARIFSGNQLPAGAEPIAQAYAGHQFGHFAMLGDGRALLLGEQITPDGKRLDLQLKGSGPTPYSRRGDGRAALGPMLREYIISEAMYALGIPTTRSLAVVTTGEQVYRDPIQPGAVLTRVAQSHIRVGTFQYLARWGKPAELQELADYTIKRHYPELFLDQMPGTSLLYLDFLRQVIRRQASLIAQWQLVGFIHGVMNTDNMAISGETIDYGPCAFLDTYDPATVFSSIDTYGRYAFGNQPQIALWNLTRFAETLLPLLDSNQEKAVELATQVLAEFHVHQEGDWLSGMRGKLGLAGEEEQDGQLIQDLLDLMTAQSADYTNTFLSLTEDQGENSPLMQSNSFQDWRQRWLDRLERQKESREEAAALMRRHNPAVIPRNHRVEEALSAAVDRGEYSVLERLLDALRTPYDYTKKQKEYAAPPQCNATPYRTFCGT